MYTVCILCIFLPLGITHFQDFGANLRILVFQCGGPGSAGLPFFLPNLRQDCHSIFASPKNVPQKTHLVGEEKEWIFICGRRGVNGRRGLPPRLSLDFSSSQHCHSLAEIAHHHQHFNKYKIPKHTNANMPILSLLSDSLESRNHTKMFTLFSYASSSTLYPCQ